MSAPSAHSCSGRMAADLLLLDHLWPDNPASRRYLATDLDRTCDQDIEQPSAACLLVRRLAFDSVGGFDTQFHPAWFEEIRSKLVPAEPGFH